MPHLDQKAIQKLSQRRCILQGRQGKEDTEDISEDHYLAGFRHKYYTLVGRCFQTFSFFLHSIFDGFLFFFFPCWCGLYVGPWKCYGNCVYFLLVAATSVEWVDNSCTFNWRYKSYCTLQNVCVSGLIMIMSLLKGGSPPKNDHLWGGGSRRKNEDGGAMVIRNGGSKNSTSLRTLQKMNAPLSIHAVRTGTSFSVWPLSFHNGSSVVRSSGLCETGFSSIHMEYRNPRQTPSSLWHSPHKLWHSTCESFCRS